MKFAIAVDGDSVAAHFGRCSGYEIVDISADGRIVRLGRLANPGHEPGRLPKMLREAGVECVLAGGMGPRAIALFEEFNIKPVIGIEGTVEEVVNQIIAGDLAAGANICEHE